MTKNNEEVIEEVQEQKVEEKKEVTVPEKFKDFVAKIESLSVLELNELVKLLEERFGVSAQAVVMAGPAAGFFSATMVFVLRSWPAFAPGAEPARAWTPGNDHVAEPARSTVRSRAGRGR